MKTSNKLIFVLISGLVLSPAFAQGFNSAMAKTMDADQDGKITKEEYMKHSSDMAAWNKMDTNKDGVLDQKEIQLGFNDK